jgi:hypothetical protein
LPSLPQAGQQFGNSGVIEQTIAASRLDPLAFLTFVSALVRLLQRKPFAEIGGFSKGAVRLAGTSTTLRMPDSGRA